MSSVRANVPEVAFSPMMMGWEGFDNGDDDDEDIVDDVERTGADHDSKEDDKVEATEDAFNAPVSPIVGASTKPILKSLQLLGIKSDMMSLSGC